MPDRIFIDTNVLLYAFLGNKDGNKAKPYQVRQVRAIILKYRLVEEV